MTPENDFDRRIVDKIEQLKAAGKLPTFEEFCQAIDIAGQQMAQEMTSQTRSQATSKTPEERDVPDTDQQPSGGRTRQEAALGTYEWV